MQHNGIFFFGYLVLFAALLSCKSPERKVENSVFDALLQLIIDVQPPAISAKEVMLLEKAVFLDAREPTEFVVSHLPTARNIGYEQPDYGVLHGLPKDTLLVIYCSIGYRSAEVGKILHDMGFEHVMNLYGGIFEWINIGGELVNNENEPTSDIHPYNRWWGIWLREGNKRYNP